MRDSTYFAATAIAPSISTVASFVGLESRDFNRLVGQSFPAVSIVLICTNDLNEKSAILWRIIPHLFDDMNSEIGYAQFSHGEM